MIAVIRETTLAPDALSARDIRCNDHAIPGSKANDILAGL
jgi:hypothetical protein